MDQPVNSPMSAPVLTRPADGHREVLIGETVVGRGPQCDLCLPFDNVSMLHAAMVWKAGGWHVRDLGSRNGTWLGGRLVESGKDISVEAGDQLSFGQGNDWVLSSAAPPVALARPVDGGATVLATAGLLVMQGAENEHFSIYQDGRPQWVLEQGSEIEEISDGHVLSVDGRRWVVRLPQGVARTQRDRAVPPAVQTLSLVLELSRDEEHVRGWVRHPTGRIDLGQRVFLYLLVMLARVRSKDREDGVSVVEQGWVHMDDLVRMLGSNENWVNVAIHRSRKLFADAGVLDAARVVERRSYQRTLRTGVADTTVEQSTAALET